MGTILEAPSNSYNNIHVFMVSFPGQGHVNPLLRLGNKLASFGIFVTVCTSEYIGQSIRKSNNITSDDAPTPVGLGSIRLEFFDDGWDLNSPNSDDLGAFLAQLELVGREKLPLMIKKHEESGRPVTCIINNPFIPWVTDVADSLGIPSAMFWVQSCACFATYYHYFHKLVDFPSEDDPDIDVKLPVMPVLKHDEIPSFLHPFTPYPFLRVAILEQFKNLHKSFCVLIDTFEELEHETIDYMSNICGPIQAIGPLFKSTSSVKRSNSKKEIRVNMFAVENCVDWLDTKPDSSVVYISFGSVVILKQEQVDEIAYGLLAAKVSFLWVLRPPSADMTVAPHVLPAAFLEETAERGKIVTWCPQDAVLAHPSIACFMTHCGWNSTLEAITNGVPVLAFPQWGDQVTDAKFLVDVYKVGVRMCRGEAEGRIVGREEVERCVKEVMGGLKLAEMRKNALELKKAAEEAAAEGGSLDRRMREFAEEIVRLGNKGSVLGQDLL